MTTADEILKLQQLRESGALTEEEFQRAKEKLMAEYNSGQCTSEGASRPKNTESDVRQWALFIHLSQFGFYAFPLAGIVLPILLWQLKKNELPGIDAHGRVVLNWVISLFIYAIICIPLCFLFVGIPMLFVLALAAVIFPIIGAIKANDGILWKYPASIQFFSVNPRDVNCVKGF